MKLHSNWPPKDFVSLAFCKAWCKLTACTEYRDSAKKKHKGNSYFAEGMWGAFPLPDRTGNFLSTMVTAKPKWVTAGTTVGDAMHLQGDN